jgi:SAM-dependent methyltransferase
MWKPSGSPLVGATCPACAGRLVDAVASTPAFNLAGCRTCGLVFSHPQPKARVREKYLQEYDLAAHFGALAPRKRVLYERRLARLLRPSDGHDRLCDVGCGDGQFLALAAQRGWRTFGVELNPPAAQQAARNGAEIFVGALEELENLPWRSFDLVTAWDVLEHTPDPRRFSERLVDLLAPGGTLAVTTLNFPSLAWRVFGTRWSMVCEDHFTYWARPSLEALFGRFGLVIEPAETFGLGRDFVWMLNRWRATTSSGRMDTVAGSATPPPQTGWDMNALVLTAENSLNHALRVFGGGVGIALTMHKR